MPRVLEREATEGGKLKDILAEELKREVGQVNKKESRTTKNTLL